MTRNDDALKGMPSPYQRVVAGYGRQAERRAAKAMGGDMIPQSGGGNSKGDFVLDGEMLVEHKATRRGSFSLKLAELVKIWHEAIMTSRKPVFVVTFTDRHGNYLEDGRWVLMPVEVFDGLCRGKNKRR